MNQSTLRDHMIAAQATQLARHAECVPVKDTEIDDLVALAKRESVDLVVVGPELPLSLGLADRLRETGFAVFGPSRAAARLESSKAFSKDLMARYGIPTARFGTSRRGRCRRFCAYRAPLVVKTDGMPRQGRDRLSRSHDADGDPPCLESALRQQGGPW